ncbi:metal-dependent hydrolase [Enhygromyxa salina]|uniref:Metal-dependent hydrolase n=1 Tax=Enhygromyxa salina TaxID=215803 RepID=A0A2S9XX29_9BACT|nr:MBL fold metallo-hydrolase [Enhygromyxa salina]PRP97403.1 metal-dependent hydrolase [Enhygromyxa salina]
MSEELVYLRGDACARPLVSRWPATEQHIPPIQSALNLVNVWLPLLRSYVEAPEYHWKAARTPALIGGPWVDIDPARVAEVETVLEAMQARERERIALARDVEQLDALVRSAATGGSMTPLYARIPPRLRGYVELVYDLANSPRVRFLEGLLYRSPHYVPELQSVALRRLAGDHRAPQFTTPVLDSDPDLCASVPLASEVYDELFAARRHGVPRARVDELGERLAISAEDRVGFRELFTAGADATFARSGPRETTPIDGLRMRYFGHACVLFETDEVSVLFDPVLAYEQPSGAPRNSWSDLPDTIDYVVLTHYHKDHFNLETLLQLRHQILRVVVPKNTGGTVEDPSFRRTLAAIGFSEIIEVDELESIALAGGELTALPFLGEHADLDISSKAAWHLRLGGFCAVCAADSANVDPELYAHIHAIVGEVDVLLLGMESVGAPLSTTYGGLLFRPLPRTLDQERRTTGSDYAGAMAIVDRLRPRRVYIYAMGLEPWLGHLLPIEASRDGQGVADSDRVIADCRRRGIIADRPHCAAELWLRNGSD